MFRSIVNFFYPPINAEPLPLPEARALPLPVVPPPLEPVPLPIPHAVTVLPSRAVAASSTQMNDELHDRIMSQAQNLLNLEAATLKRKLVPKLQPELQLFFQTVKERNFFGANAEISTATHTTVKSMKVGSRDITPLKNLVSLLSQGQQEELKAFIRILVKIRAKTMTTVSVEERTITEAARGVIGYSETDTKTATLSHLVLKDLFRHYYKVFSPY